jgi:integrase
MSVIRHPDGKRLIAVVNYRCYAGHCDTGRHQARRIVDTPREANRIERDLLNKRDANDLPFMTAPVAETPGVPTLAQYVDSYLADRRKPGRKQLSAEAESRYCYALRHVVNRCGTVKLDQLTNAMIDEAYDTMRDDGLAESTIGLTHKTLRTLLKSAASGRNPIITWNPSDEVHAPSTEPNAKRVILSADDVAKLIDTADGAYGSLVRFLAWTGCRLGEGLALRWEDVDFERSRVAIRHSLNKRGELGPTKTRRDRFVSLSAATVDVLRGVLESQLLDKMNAPTGRDGKTLYRDRGFVFANVIGTPIGHAEMENVWRNKIRKVAGIPGARIHDLRHAHATHLLRNGVPIATVSKRLGHASIQTTLTVYAHALPSDDEIAATMVDSVFGGR